MAYLKKRMKQRRQLEYLRSITPSERVQRQSKFESSQFKLQNVQILDNVENVSEEQRSSTFNRNSVPAHDASVLPSRYLDGSNAKLRNKPIDLLYSSYALKQKAEQSLLEFQHIRQQTFNTVNMDYDSGSRPDTEANARAGNMRMTKNIVLSKPSQIVQGKQQLYQITNQATLSPNYASSAPRTRERQNLNADVHFADQVDQRMAVDQPAITAKASYSDLIKW